MAVYTKERYSHYKQEVKTLSRILIGNCCIRLPHNDIIIYSFQFDRQTYFLPVKCNYLFLFLIN